MHLLRRHLLLSMMGEGLADLMWEARWGHLVPSVRRVAHLLGAILPVFQGRQDLLGEKILLLVVWDLA